MIQNDKGGRNASYRAHFSDLLRVEHYAPEPIRGEYYIRWGADVYAWVPARIDARAISYPLPVRRRNA